jgi:hypothetical protein
MCYPPQEKIFSFWWVGTEEAKELQFIFHSREDKIIIGNGLTKKIVFFMIDCLANLYINMV